MPRSALTARPTTYNGIEMRSRLEARYAAWLDSRELVWEYEPRAYANARGQYLPDFRILPTETTPSTFIEVRPNVEGMSRALSQMPVIWDSEPDAFLLVTAPNVGWEWFATGRGSHKWLVVPGVEW